MKPALFVEEEEPERASPEPEGLWVIECASATAMRGEPYYLINAEDAEGRLYADRLGGVYLGPLLFTYEEANNIMARWLVAGPRGKATYKIRIATPALIGRGVEFRLRPVARVI